MSFMGLTFRIPNMSEDRKEKEKSEEDKLRGGCEWFFQMILDKAKEKDVALADNAPKWVRVNAKERLADLLLATNYVKPKLYQIGTRELLGAGEDDADSKRSLETWAGSVLSDIGKAKPGSL
jgi:hypothetical protein